MILSLCTGKNRSRGHSYSFGMLLAWHIEEFAQTNLFQCPSLATEVLSQMENQPDYEGGKSGMLKCLETQRLVLVLSHTWPNCSWFQHFPSRKSWTCTARLGNSSGITQSTKGQDYREWILLCPPRSWVTGSDYKMTRIKLLWPGPPSTHMFESSLKHQFNDWTSVTLFFREF